MGPVTAPLHYMTEEPKSASTFSGTTVAAITFGGALLLTGGLIAGTVLARMGEPTTAVATPTAMATPKTALTGGIADRRIGIQDEREDTLGISDPEVTAWHETVRVPISAVVNVLTMPAPENKTQLASVCERIGMALDDLNAAAPAPRDDVDAKFRTWLGSLEAAVSECVTAQSRSDAEALKIAQDSFKGTSDDFVNFTRQLDLYFDFSAEPIGPVRP